jgi:hypothetical protein
LPTTAVPAKNGQAKASGDPLAGLEALYGWALNASFRLWHAEAVGSGVENATLHATAATLFIEANRQGLRAPAPGDGVIPGTEPDDAPPLGTEPPEALRGDADESEDGLPW